eukprot:756845-Prymnesium_polylepis.1
MPWAPPGCVCVHVHHARVPVTTCHLADRESTRRGRIRGREIGSERDTRVRARHLAAPAASPAHGLISQLTSGAHLCRAFL